jgi:hypothetical protein
MGARVKSLKEIVELAECGKRMHNAVNQALTDFGPWQIKDCWMAFELQTGQVDSIKSAVLYDTLKAAKAHTDEMYYCYYSFRCAMSGISARDCEIFLDFHRQARNISRGQSDPDRTPIMPFGAGDIFRSAQRGEL